MTILDYSKCHQCKHIRTRQNKETFNKILPEEIGNIIQSFNCCSNCEHLINLENHYYFEEHPLTHNLSTFEKQLFILNDRDNIDVYFTDDNVETKKQKLVNIFKNSNNPYKKVIIYFIKNRQVRFFEKFDEIVDFIHNKKTMYHITTQTNILRLNYSYYNKTYPDKVLFKNIMYEFLINFIGNDINYLNLDELQEHLNEIFDKEED